MNGFLAFLGILLLIAFILFIPAVVAWNVLDIVNNGASFWSIFCALALVGLFIFGGTSVAGKKS